MYSQSAVTTVPVLIQVKLDPTPLPHSLIMTISVILVAINLVIIQICSMLMTHCGVVRDVLLLAAAVRSTLLHGSVSLYLNLPQMTRRLDCVTTTEVFMQTKLLLW